MRGQMSRGQMFDIHCDSCRRIGVMMVIGRSRVRLRTRIDEPTNLGDARRRHASAVDPGIPASAQSQSQRRCARHG